MKISWMATTLQNCVEGTGARPMALWRGPALLVTCLVRIINRNKQKHWNDAEELYSALICFRLRRRNLNEFDIFFETRSVTRRFVFARWRLEIPISCHFRNFVRDGRPDYGPMDRRTDGLSDRQNLKTGNHFLVIFFFKRGVRVLSLYG